METFSFCGEKVSVEPLSLVILRFSIGVVLAKMSLVNQLFRIGNLFACREVAAGKSSL
jgi:hypothetical protein